MRYSGLRVDVDTLRGTRVGVPKLLALFRSRSIRATFFFSVGPDNMGRHVWRLLRPRFLAKMFRTNAAKLYGWDILLRGVFWPGPQIGNRCRETIRQTAAAGHEVGLHAWDHQRWQAKLDTMDQPAIAAEIGKGCDALTDILGQTPTCFAAPSWMMNDAALLAAEQFPFFYQSSCRGHAPFYPLAASVACRQVQVPTTLPTFDELVGRACPIEAYNDVLLAKFRPGGLNVLTIHAEVEGVACHDLFRDFLNKAEQRDIRFVPLGELLPGHKSIRPGRITQQTITGRDGWVAAQG